MATNYNFKDPMQVEYISVFEVIARNKRSFEKRFLRGNTHYNQANHLSEQKILCLVYLDYPITTMNTVQYTITYNQFYNWMLNQKLFDFMDGKDG